MIVIQLKASRTLLASPWGDDFRYMYFSLAEIIKSGNVMSVIV